MLSSTHSLTWWVGSAWGQGRGGGRGLGPAQVPGAGCDAPLGLGQRRGSALGGAAVAPGMWLTAPHLSQVRPPALALPRTPSWHWAWQGWWWDCWARVPAASSFVSGLRDPGDWLLPGTRCCRLPGVLSQSLDMVMGLAPDRGPGLGPHPPKGPLRPRADLELLRDWGWRNLDLRVSWMDSLSSRPHHPGGACGLPGVKGRWCHWSTFSSLHRLSAPPPRPRGQRRWQEHRTSTRRTVPMRR